MCVCTFFGHRNAPLKIEQVLHSTIIDLIENKNVTCFYIGNHGNFDNIAYKVLKQIAKKYPHIEFYVVLAYLPTQKDYCDCSEYSHTIYPEGLESTPPRLAIIKRNQWMIEQADYVITYVKHSSGGAAKFKKAAEKNNKTVINII